MAFHGLQLYEGDPKSQERTRINSFVIAVHIGRTPLIPEVLSAAKSDP